ncbi:ABC transporter ATP-binding protein [Haloimpatiens massiliensis]|uniref:ABC transporter ATP-binding protein n=1 Tax=Haloimpatiens massiliensis TaxID=1658110 RepID=UPI000C815E7E|nr:ABC transporter ATP-binding protein [Haloimpatiens massiliensis]
MRKKKKVYTLKALKEVNALAYKSSPLAYVFLVLTTSLSAINTFILLKATEYTINSAYRLFDKTIYFKSVVMGITLFTLSKIIFKIIDIIKTLLINKLNLSLSYAFEKELNTKLSNIKIDYYESNKTYVKIHEVRTKTLETMKNFIESTMFYIESVFHAIVYGYFLIQINILVVVIYLALVVIFNKVAGNMYNSIMNIWEEIQPYSQKQNYFFSLSGDKVTHQEFKFNRLFGFVSSRWDKLYDKEYKYRMKIFKKFEITLQIARIVFNLPYIAMLIYVAFEIVVGKHEIGFLMLCNQLFNGIIDTFAGVQNTIMTNSVDCKFIKSYDEIMDYEEDNNIYTEEKVDNISFENVIYTYPQAKRYALKNLKLNIKLGEKIAVVGHNGSGKTTFTNLLMALMSSTNGKIVVDGYKGLKAESILRSSVSCILQDFAQYQMTIRENIEVGYENHKFSEKEIWSLLDTVGLKKRVLKLPQGIDTPLGQLQKGIELSKGQWQRLAIARLMANPQATLWILDEPTAYLDPISEIEIYDMIYNLAGDRTVLFISHRLGFAKRADRIVVFNEGQITEEGVHRDLLNKDGIYAKMYKNQESWYVA